MSNKMLTFNYSDAKCIVICGDIHGAWFNASWESDTESAQKNEICAETVSLSMVIVFHNLWFSRILRK